MDFNNNAILPSTTTINSPDIIPIMVPYSWQRNIIWHRSEPLVHYISPSGRVLFSQEDVNAYLADPLSCKCYLQDAPQSNRVFNFDGTIGCYYLPPVVRPMDPFEQWEKAMPANMFAAFSNEMMATFQNNLITDEYEQFQVLTKQRRQSSEHQLAQFKKWLSQHDWSKFMITSSGQVFEKNLTDSQRRHLLWERIRADCNEERCQCKAYGLSVDPVLIDLIKTTSKNTTISS